MKSNVLEFWQAVEALTPQDALRVNPHDVAQPVYGIKDAAQSVFPWKDRSHLAKPIEANMVWVYDAQCGLYDSKLLAQLVVEALHRPAEEDACDGPGGVARLFDLRFDHAGMPVPQSFVLSLAAWASGYLLRQGATLEKLLAGASVERTDLPEPSSEVANPQSGFSGFDDVSMGIMQWLADEVERFHEQQQSPSPQWLSSLVEMVAQHLNIPAFLVMHDSMARVRSTRVRKDRAQDRNEFSEGLCSFYAADLRKIAGAARKGDCGKGMQQFMAGAAARSRIDVRDERSNQFLADALAPMNMPRGRWPADHALAFSQQLAVNSIFKSLRNDAGLFSVNGPPGTGKTTLLRDVVAEVVTERAAMLVKLGANVFGTRTVTKVGDAAAPFYPLHQSLHGFSIVVATNGNGAAENVTLEMPGRDAVPDRVADRSNYFPDLASSVAGKQAWGLLAAPLGNWKNRTEFVSRFWWGPRKGSDEPAAQHRVAMREHLRSLASGTHVPLVSWDQAVTRFKRALRDEAACRKHVSDVAALPAKAAVLVSEVQQMECALRASEQEHLHSQDALQDMQRRLASLRCSLAEAQGLEKNAGAMLRHHLQSKPSLLNILFTLGRSSAAWQSKHTTLAYNLEIAGARVQEQQSVICALEQHMDALKLGCARLSLKVSSAATDSSKAKRALLALEQEMAESIEHFGAAWLDVELDQERREHLIPWGEPRWLAAREEVFLSALDVHRAFLEAHPAQMAANLAVACDWLSGKGVDPALITAALDTLCMVVPVVSATFASFPRMFAKAPSEAIGYLLIDEGGQAQAAHVACAIWRARRTVVVGDPLQLEPVVTVPRVIESELAEHYHVETPWMPSWNSAQGLADMSSMIGTYLGTVPGEKLWIGCPLRLHRRCAPEMFHISNEIAYEGMMVYGKTLGDSEIWPETAWLDVKATVSEGHWIDAEGGRLRQLISELIDMGVDRNQLALITPFRDCASRLRKIASIFALDAGKVGTVHTAQGKEADIVILVLGGNPRSSGAKAWAASKPNLLNVAVSRAKKRLYVIGDVDLWRQHSYFSVMARQLPSQAHISA